MAYTHVPLHPGPDIEYRSLRAIRFSTDLPRPEFVWVPAQSYAKHNYALVDSIVRGRDIWDHIRHTKVVVIDRFGRTHNFVVFFKNHRRLDINRSISNLVPGKQWKGDIVVLRVAARGQNRVVNMIAYDQYLAAVAIKKAVKTIRLGTRPYVPKVIHAQMNVRHN